MNDQKRIVVTHTGNGNKYTLEPSGKNVSDKRLHFLISNKIIAPVYGGLFGDDIQEYVFVYRF